jgi:hypothetical protein
LRNDDTHAGATASPCPPMPQVGPTWMFHEMAVLVDLHAWFALPEARRVIAAVHVLVRRLEDTYAKPSLYPTRAGQGASFALIFSIPAIRAPSRSPDFRSGSMVPSKIVCRSALLSRDMRSASPPNS